MFTFCVTLNLKKHTKCKQKELKIMENEAPALLIFKNMSQIIEKLTDAERLEVFDAILKYSSSKEMPKLTKSADLVFSMLKMQFDENEKRYKQEILNNRERQRRFRNNQKTETEDREEIKVKGIPKNVQKAEETAKNNEIQHHLNNKQALFFKSFQEHCPGKAIDCQISDMPAVDYDALMLAIKQSPQFLMKADNLSLKWCLEHANEIIAGKWKQYEDTKKQANFTQREYTAEELNALFQNVDEIEI